MAQIKVDEPDIMIVVKAGTTYRWTKHAWDLLPQAQKDEYDYIGAEGNGGNIPIKQHQAKPQQEIIPIKIPIKEEPLTEEIKVKTDEPMDRDALKEYFSKNPVEGYYDKMPTKKMIELYESQK